MIECPHCSTESKDGVSVCRGCNAEITYKTTETVKSRMKSSIAGAGMLVGFGMASKNDGVGLILGAVIGIGCTVLLYKWWWLNREYNDTQRTFTRSK